MQHSADSIYARLDAHDRDLDRMQAWQNRADGAMVLARWALGGTSGLAAGNRFTTARGQPRGPANSRVELRKTGRGESLKPPAPTSCRRTSARTAR